MLPKDRARKLEKRISRVTDTLFALDVLRLQMLGQKVLMSDELNALCPINPEPERSDIIFQET